jgi:hypothetical protein
MSAVARLVVLRPDGEREEDYSLLNDGTPISIGR